MTSGRTIDEARAAKSKATQLLKDLSLDAGIGIARFADGFCLKVNLQEPLDDPDALPEEIDGVPIKIDVVGPIKKR